MAKETERLTYEEALEFANEYLPRWISKCKKQQLIQLFGGRPNAKKDTFPSVVFPVAKSMIVDLLNGLDDKVVQSQTIDPIVYFANPGEDRYDLVGDRRVVLAAQGIARVQRDYNWR